MKFLIPAALIIGTMLGCFWLLWCLYCSVMRGLWPAGPQSLVNPGFWLFIGAWTLLSMVGSAIFKSGTRRKS